MNNTVQIFVLMRHKDISGNSGTGIVAEGVVFSDGKVAVRWLTETATTVLFDSIEDVEKIHGHEGATEIQVVEHVEYEERDQVDDAVNDLIGV